MLSDTKMVHMLVEVIEHSRKNIDAKPHEQTTSTSILFFFVSWTQNNVNSKPNSGKL